MIKQAQAHSAAEIDRNLRLLFVGSEPRWFDEVSTGLHALHPDWIPAHAADASAAKAKSVAGRFDAYFIETSLPKWEALLAELTKDHPHSVYFLLSPEPGRLPMEHLKSIHQALALPSNPSAASLAEHLSRSKLVQDLMGDPSIKRLLPSIKKLPTLPRLFLQVTEELESSNGSLETVSQLIRQDPVISGKLLQIANSVAIGLAFTVTDPGEAVMLLGAGRIRALVLMAGIFTQFKDAAYPGFSAEQVWDHSLLVGRLARAITLFETEDVQMAELAFTSGLLHDVGKLILAANLPDMLAPVSKYCLAKECSPLDAEFALLGTSHAELGGCLLGTWGLPLALIRAVAWHHFPGRSADQGFSVLTAVHVANVFSYDNLPKEAESTFSSRMSVAYLAGIGVNYRANIWREACGLATKEEDVPPTERVRRRQEARVN